MLDRRSNVEVAHQQTCQWIFELEAYRTWQSQPSGLLWIKGKPGSGKSTMMLTLYRAIHRKMPTKHGVYLEFFFTARGAILQRTIPGMLRSLLNQLFRQSHDVRDILRLPFIEKCQSFGRDQNSNWEWQKSELEQLLGDMICTTAEKRPVVVFIDALDEAGEHAAREVAHYFHGINDRISKSSLTAKVCISCRHYPIPSHVQAMEIHMEAYNTADITTYVRDCLNIEQLSAEHETSRTQWQELVQTLVSMAQGIFQWVRLVLPMVSKSISDGETPEEILQWVSHVPSELGDVYRHILENVIDPRYRARAFRLFQWVCLARSSLSLTEMRHALVAHNLDMHSTQTRCTDQTDFIKTDDAMRLRVRAWSGGLIEAPGARNSQVRISTIQVIHQSVRDYIVAQGLMFLGSLVTEEERLIGANLATNVSSFIVRACHADLYRSCLKYVQSKQQATNDSGFVASEFALFNYAIQNILVHAEHAGQYRSHEVEEGVQALTDIVPLLIPVCRNLLATNGLQMVCESEGTTLLHICAAVKLNDLAACLLDEGTEVDVVNCIGRTPLHLAVLCDSLDIVKMLVRKGADVNRPAWGNDTPLVMAASQGNRDVFSWLLNHGASFKTTSHDSDNALCVAVERGNIGLVKMCMDAGVDINDETGYSGTALQMASHRNDLKIARLLLRAGANVNSPGGIYGTALEAALFYGNRDMVRLLVEARADVNMSGKYGTALEQASAYGDSEIVRSLINAGADVNVRGKLYSSPLEAAMKHGHNDVMEILETAGASMKSASDTESEDASDLLILR